MLKRRLQALLPWMSALVFLLTALAAWRLAREHAAEGLGPALAGIGAGDLCAAALCLSLIHI